jgi:hypothetical protein
MKKTGRLQDSAEERWENLPSGSNWRKVLLAIYGRAPHMYGESSKMYFNDDAHPLAQKLKITGYELMLCLSYLEKQKLVERSLGMGGKDMPYSASLEITEKGFSVALDLLKHRDQVGIQVLIGVFTVILVITESFDLMIRLQNNLAYLGVYVATVVAMGLIGIAFFKKRE